VSRRVVALIPARGGSKGVLRKNIRPLAGKPLIAYAIEIARASKLIERVVVSTDDAEIAAIARRHGADVPFMRPAELAQDDSPEWLTWQHAVRMLQAAETGSSIDAFVCVSPTSPLRAVEDVDACIQLLLESDADLVMTVRPSERNPYFNMVVLDGSGYARVVMRPERPIYRRQDAPVVYDITTVAYTFRPAFVLRTTSEFDGKVRAVVVPAERALDIDTELDFAFAEFLLSRAAR
jgi:N,N'-diacetyl-8-epilegionaminate cytidylyltransferase